MSDMKVFTSTEAQNRFGFMLDTARQSPVAVRKQGRVVAVMISIEEYERLSALEDEILAIQALTAEKEGYLGAKASASFLKAKRRRLAQGNKSAGKSTKK